MSSQKSARAAPARAGSDPRIEQLPGRLNRANSNFGSSSQPDTWQPLGVAALNALSRLIGGRDA